MTFQRREFITLLGGAAAAWPVGARAQQRDRMRRIGVLMGLAADDPVAQASIRALQQGLRVLGWLEGTNLAIEYRYVAGSTDPANAAAELVTLQCEVIVARGRQWSQRFSGLPAPFQSFLQPLANPLRAILSPVTSIPEVLLLVSLISSPQSPASGSSCLRRSYPASGDVPLSPLVNTNQRRINTLAIGAQLPTFYAARDYVETGGLMSYGPNYTVLWRRTADFVDKILQGTNPADIPVEQPVKFDLVVNLTTAKAIGLTIPETFLVRADEVIE